MQKTAHTVTAPASSSSLAASAETVLAFLRSAAKGLRLAVSVEAVLPIGKGEALKVSFVFSHADAAESDAGVLRQIIGAVERLAAMTTPAELTRVLGVAAGDLSLMKPPTAAGLLAYLTPESATTLLGRQIPESAPVPETSTQLELESETL